ncbi:hypothetical protein D3C72_1989720 [compost metagenome]
MLVALVAGIANSLEQVFVEVLPVWQLGLVQLLVNTGLDLLGEEVIGRHHNVVTGLAGQQLGFQGFVAVEDVIDDFDPGGFFEVGHSVRGDVVGPVVDVQHLVVRLSRSRHDSHQGHGEQSLASELFA